MRKEKKENNSTKLHKSWIILVFITIILSLIASIYSIYHILLLGPIEPVIRYILVGILIIIDIFALYKVFKILKGKKKKRRPLLFIILMSFYIIINSVIGFMIGKVYGSLDNINKEYITYTTTLITMSNKEINSIDDVEELTIGIINDEESIEGYIISQEMIKENKITEKNDLEEYSDYSSMMADLYDGKIDALFISSNYPTMFQGIEEYEQIKQDTKVIISKDKEMKKEQELESIFSSSGKEITEPFTILLMGVDSEVDGLDKNTIANGDSLMVVTFNPKTLNVTMLSIPRDTYVPIACFKNQIENKITHAAWYGESCMIKTIQNFTGINIDYYAKINFKGVVGLVDALGGIDVEVPQDLCTDSSDRGGKVCINKGYQHLNGEQALVLARNRKQLANGDIDRGLNQQLVIQGMINSAKSIRSVNTLLDILNTVSRNMDTNLTTEQILSFYNIGKNILARSLDKENGEIVNIQQLFLQGSGQMIYDEGAKMVLWNYIPNKESIKDIVKEMKVNLELENHELIKTFSFSINEPYEKPIIGSGPYNTNSNYSLLPDFTGDTKEEAQKWANNNGVKISFETKETNEYKDGTVFAQSVPPRKRLDKLDETVVLTIAEKEKNNSNNVEEIDCSKDTKNKACLVPNFTKMTKQEINAWVKPLKDVVITYENVVMTGVKDGQIISQSVEANTYLKDTTKITIGVAKADSSDDEEEKDEKDDDSTKEESTEKEDTPKEENKEEVPTE